MTRSITSLVFRQFPTNPWFGTDSKYIAGVRRSFDRLPQMPDGPPLDRTEAARLKAKLAGDITEAYYADYETTPSGAARGVSDLLRVQAVRYTDAKWATPDPPMHALTAARRDAINSFRIVRGSTVILITGNPQRECFKAVRTFIESLR